MSQKNIDILAELLAKMSTALSDAARVSSGASLTIIEGWKVTTGTARNTVSAVDAGLTLAESTLASAQISQGSSASAQVSVAEAGVKNLEAQLAKTVITSPITGVIAALPLRTGELASPGALIATVVGGGGLEIKAYASGEDLPRIKAGAKALVRGTVAGTVTSVSPSLNQVTRKAEVRIAVTDAAASSLVVGQNVPVSIEAGVVATTASSSTYLLPIQNVKIIPGDASVFTVDSESEIVRNPVTLGRVQGDFVEVTSGITDGMRIVSPVYEIEAGQKVDVQ